MSEQNPLFDQIQDLEDSIVTLESGIHALEGLAQDIIENPREETAAGLHFLARGFRGVHEDLRARFEALHKAARGSG